MNDKYSNIYIYILILSIIFYILNLLDKKKLLVILIIIIIGYFFYLRYINIQNNIETNNKILSNKINNNLNNSSNNIYSNNYNINKIPKNFKFLLKDDMLVKILLNIEFIKKFNKSRYTDILIISNKMMQIYIYILSDIYHPNLYLSTFTDLRENILELLHSIILIIPIKFKYTYGIDPIYELNKSIKEFTMRTRKLITIIENYSKYEKNNIYIEDTLYTPYNKISKLNNIMH